MGIIQKAQTNNKHTEKPISIQNNNKRKATKKPHPTGSCPVGYNPEMLMFY